jgi:hypothetical protein
MYQIMLARASRGGYVLTDFITVSGRVAERLNAPVLKTGEDASPP